MIVAVKLDVAVAVAVCVNVTAAGMVVAGLVSHWYHDCFLGQHLLVIVVVNVTLAILLLTDVAVIVAVARFHQY